MKERSRRIGRTTLRVVMAALSLTVSACDPLEDDVPDPPEQPDPPEPVDPTRVVGPIKEISPKVALAGQALTVTIKLDGEAPGPGSVVSFGDGIEVGKTVEVPGGLAVDITVDVDAVAGVRNVSVTPDNAAIVTSEGGFTVASAIDITSADGKAEQGGLVRLGVSTKDGKTLTGATFSLEPIVDEGVPSLLQIARGTFTTTTGSVVMLGDPLAKVGPLGLIGYNDPDDPKSATFFADAAVTVAARTPVAVTSGPVTESTLSSPLQTAFYVADVAPGTGEGLLVDAWAKKKVGSTLVPVLYGYGAAGGSEDLLEVKPEVAATAGVPEQQARIAVPVTAPSRSFFTVFDKDLKASATSTLAFDFKTYRATIVAEVATPHGLAAKQNLGALPLGTDPVPGRIITGKLDAAAEVDAYEFTVPVGTPYRNVQISLVSQAELDVVIDHVPNFDDDPTTFSNADRATSGLTTNFPDGNRYIRVTAAPKSTKATGSYTLGIRVVD